MVLRYCKINKTIMKDINIRFDSRGGQFPYQAEGNINDDIYFYYRARHE